MHAVRYFRRAIVGAVGAVGSLGRWRLGFRLLEITIPSVAFGISHCPSKTAISNKQINITFAEYSARIICDQSWFSPLSQAFKNKLMKNSLDSSGRFKTNRPYSTFTFCSRKFDPAEVTDQYSECMVLKLKFAYIHDWLLSRQSSLPSGVSQDLPVWSYRKWWRHQILPDP